MTSGYWVGIAGGLTIMFLVVEMVRRRRLRGRFAVAWVALGSFSIMLAAIPRVLRAVAEFANVDVPVNLLFFAGFIALIAIILQLSAESGKLEERTRILAEELALLRRSVGSGTMVPGEGRGSESVKTVPLEPESEPSRCAPV